MAKGNGKAPAQEALIPGLEDEAPAQAVAQPEAVASRNVASEAVSSEEPVPDDVHAVAELTESEPAPAAPEASVLELANTTAGCWKVLENEERVELSDADWRRELAHLFRREAPAPRA